MTTIDDMMDNYTKLLNYLKSKVKRIVLITVPPIPRLQDKFNHWVKLDKFNQFILSQAYGKFSKIVKC